MATTVGMAEMARETWASKLRCYYTLSKPEVNLLILMTTSAGYYLSSRGPVRIAGLINTLIGHAPGRQRNRNPQSVDGTRVGRANAPHRVAPTAFRPTQCTGSAGLRSHAQHHRRSLSTPYCECPVGGIGSFHTALLSAHLHAAEARDATLHRAGCLPGCDAHTDRLGRRLERPSTGTPGCSLPSSSSGSSPTSSRLR